MEKNGLLLIGKIVGTHGLKGCIKVNSYAESPSIFKPNILILAKNTGGFEKNYTVEWAKPHKNIVRMCLKEVTSISLSEAIVGSEIFIEKAALSKPEDGAYYWCDIIGLSVFTTDDVYLGRVESIMPTGSNDVYVVKNPDTDKEKLIPALESIVLKIDLARATMTVDLPEGL